jgi:hypothetical protein
MTLTTDIARTIRTNSEADLFNRWPRVQLGPHVWQCRKRCVAPFWRRRGGSGPDGQSRQAPACRAGHPGLRARAHRATFRAACMTVRDRPLSGTSLARRGPASGDRARWEPHSGHPRPRRRPQPAFRLAVAPHAAALGRASGRHLPCAHYAREVGCYDRIVRRLPVIRTSTRRRATVLARGFSRPARRPRRVAGSDHSGVVLFAVFASSHFRTSSVVRNASTASLKSSISGYEREPMRAVTSSGNGPQMRLNSRSRMPVPASAFPCLSLGLSLRLSLRLSLLLSLLLGQSLHGCDVGHLRLLLVCDQVRAKPRLPIGS